MRDTLLGASYLLRGLRLMVRPGLRRYALIPLAINVTVFALGGLYLWLRITETVNRTLGPGLHWLEWLLWPLVALGLLVVAYFTFTIGAALMSAPFNGFLSVAVERFLTGHRPGGNASFAAEALRSLWMEVIKLRYIVVRGVPLALMLFIPGLGALAPFAWLLFSARVQAIEFLDYPMSNHGLSFPAQRAVHRSHRGLSLGFGAATTFALLTPGLNLVTIPAAVAGATALWVERLAPDARTREARPPSGMDGPTGARSLREQASSGI